MSMIDSRIRTYISDYVGQGKVVSVHTIAKALHGQFPELHLNQIAERVAELAIERGANIACDRSARRRASRFGSIEECLDERPSRL